MRLTKSILKNIIIEELYKIKGYIEINKLVKTLEDYNISTPAKMNILEIDEKDIKSEKIIKVLGNELTIKNIKLEKRKHFIGIRPEHLKINNETKFKFSPEIDIIENLGNEKIVYMKKDNHQLSAKISSGTEIGNSFGFDLQNIFIFNENGKRIKS